ncbi:MAG: hypothetical protein V1774_03945 [Candidatus Eisenbacteria bacterium]
MSRGVNNLIVVETPFQLLNATEYRQRAGWDAPSLLVLLVPPFTRRNFAGLLRSAEWRSVTYLPVYSPRDIAIGSRPPEECGFLHEQYKNLRRLRLRGGLDRFARRNGPVETLVIGNYLRGHKDYIRHLTNVVAHRQLVLVDDGTDTLTVSDQRRAALEQKATACDTGGSRSWKERGRDRWLDFQTREAPALTYFSVYDLELPAADTFVKNDYRALRALAREARRTEEIYFLGQCLVADGYMPAATYRRAMTEVLAHFSTQRITYVAHPRESQGDLEALQGLGMEMTRFERPIEYELIVSGLRPQRLAGFFCSALENSRLIFGDDLPVTCFQLPSGLLDKNRPEVARIYEALTRHSGPHFTVVPLTGRVPPGAEQVLLRAPK